MLSRVTLAIELGTAVRDVDLAIEAVPERLEVKRGVFARHDERCPARTILATNSSSIRVSRVQDATGRPERVAHYHVLMPVWDYPLVEVGGGSATTNQTLADISEFAREIGLLPRRVRQMSTGFVFNTSGDRSRKKHDQWSRRIAPPRTMSIGFGWSCSGRTPLRHWRRWTRLGSLSSCGSENMMTLRAVTQATGQCRSSQRKSDAGRVDMRLAWGLMNIPIQATLHPRLCAPYHHHTPAGVTR